MSQLFVCSSCVRSARARRSAVVCGVAPGTSTVPLEYQHWNKKQHSLCSSRVKTFKGSNLSDEVVEILSTATVQVDMAVDTLTVVTQQQGHLTGRVDKMTETVDKMTETVGKMTERVSKLTERVNKLTESVHDLPTKTYIEQRISALQTSLKEDLPTKATMDEIARCMKSSMRETVDEVGKTKNMVMTSLGSLVGIVVGLILRGMYISRWGAPESVGNLLFVITALLAVIGGFVGHTKSVASLRSLVKSFDEVVSADATQIVSEPPKADSKADAQADATVKNTTYAV